MQSIIEKIKNQPEQLSEENVANGVYNFDFGFGEGVNLIFNDYIGFGQYILTSRHVPHLEDGLKSVQRASLYSGYLYESKQKNVTYRKSAKLTSDVMNDYHPHGDSSIYKAFARMTESNGSAKIPMFDGHGQFGDKYSTDAPASQRYTDIRLHDNAYFMFDALEGAKMVESKATERLEITESLPTKYPYALVGMSQEGTAIGLSTSTAIYDVVDVANLIQEYLKTGKMTDVLAPDFVSGCYIVQNTKEFKKLMTSGKAKIKTRGKAEIRGKEIFLTEFPYGVKQEHLIKEINDLGLARVTAYNGSTYGEKSSVRVKCPSKSSTTEVLNKIYLNTSFQKNVNISCRFLFDMKLFTGGLYDSVKAWVSSREQVLSRKYNVVLSQLKASAQKYEPLVRLLQNTEKHKEFMRIFSDITRPESDASDFLREFGCDEPAIDFIMSRTMKSLRNGGRYLSQYNGTLAEISEYEKKLSDLKAVIYQDMEDMKRDWGKYKRLSEITTEDYVKVEREDEVVTTNVLIQDNLMSRIDGLVSVSDSTRVIETRTDQNIVVGLKDGSILTFKVKDLPQGYPAISGVPINNSRGSLHEVLFVEEAQEGKEVYIYYNTGFLSFVDLTEYTRTTNISRIKINQLPKAHLNEISEVGIWTEEIANRVSFQLSNWEVCWMSWGEIKHKKSNAVSRLIVPSSDMLLMVAQRYEVEGQWYMNEEYHRPRPKKIRNIEAWNLSNYINEMWKEAEARGADVDEATLEQIQKRVEYISKPSYERE